MIGLVFDETITEVLCLGAHADDIEIGALGLLRRLGSRYPDARFTFVVLSGDDRRRAEATRSVTELFGGRGSLRVGGFTDGFIPYESPAEVKRFVKAALEGCSPQVVLTPSERDRHQDHAFLARLGQQLLRDHLVLEYEIPKYDGDLGRPEVFVTLTEDEVEAKLGHMRSHFESQHDHPWYDDSGFRALLRLRGIEAASPTGYAEAFHVSKLVLA